MAFRGGRGGGRFGRGGFRFAKQESFVLFPDIELPEKSNVTAEELKLLQLNRKLQLHFKSSPYYLNENCLDNKEEENIDIERYSDMVKRKNRSSSQSLQDSGYLLLKRGYFPMELVRGTRQKIGRKAQWNLKKGFQKLDQLEQLEAKLKDQDPEAEKENKDDEDEDEEEDNAEEEEESDEGDYGKGEEFDDDEDDYNMVDDGDDEPIM